MTPRLGLLLLLSLSACVVDRAGTRTDGSRDAGAVDSGAVDSGALDSGGRDATTADSGAVDSGAVDSGARDAGARDSGAGCGRAETCNGLDDDCDGVIDNGADCPCNHQQFRGHSYLVCEEWDLSQTWRSSRDECRGLGYELMTVNDVDEQVWIASQFANSFTAYWIGLHDHGSGGEGDYRWIADDSALTYSNWGSGEPNNDGPLGAEEDCVVIETEKAPRSGGVAPGWNDQPCYFANRYVCEASR